MNFLRRTIKYTISLILGLLTVFKHLFKKPVTLEYPEKKNELNDNFRGEQALVVDTNGNIKCIACGTCQRVCPSCGTIYIEKDKNESGKFYPKIFNIDLSSCIFCGNCVKFCPQHAIVMTKVYELAKDSKSVLKLGIEGLKSNYFKSKGMKI